MRFHTPFDDLFRNRTSVRLLRTLARFPGKEFTGRELAMESGTAAPNAIRELNRLRSHGLVERRTVGRSQLWRFRKAHVLAAPLSEIFKTEREPLEELRRACVTPLARIPGVRRIVLFGSVARGDEHPESDIDLLVVVDRPRGRAAAEAALDRLAADIILRFANRLSAVVYAEEELASRRAEAVRRSVEREGVVWWERPR